MDNLEGLPQNIKEKILEIQSVRRETNTFKRKNKEKDLYISTKIRHLHGKLNDILKEQKKELEEEKLHYSELAEQAKKLEEAEVTYDLSTC